MVCSTETHTLNNMHYCFTALLLHCSTALQALLLQHHHGDIIRIRIPLINFLYTTLSARNTNKMSEQPQRCSDIMKFWPDIDRNFIVFIIQLPQTFCPHKLMFGQTTNKNGQK